MQFNYATTEDLMNILQNAPWTLVRESNERISIQGYAIPSLSPESSEMNVYKVVSKQKVSANILVDLFHSQGVDAIKKYSANFIGGRVIKVVNGSTSIIQKKYKMPFPMHNRDFVVSHQLISLNNGSYAILERSVNDAVPEDSHTTRGTYLFYLRLLTPCPGGSTIMTNMQWYNLGGKMPSGAADLKAVDGIFDEALAVNALIEAAQAN